jgi:hypothetical protein
VRWRRLASGYGRKFSNAANDGVNLSGGFRVPSFLWFVLELRLFEVETQMATTPSRVLPAVIVRPWASIVDVDVWTAFTIADFNPASCVPPNGVGMPFTKV